MAASCAQTLVLGFLLVSRSFLVSTPLEVTEEANKCLFFFPSVFVALGFVGFLKSKEPDSAVIFIGTNPDANPVKSVQFFLLKN